MTARPAWRKFVATLTGTARSLGGLCELRSLAENGATAPRLLAQVEAGTAEGLVAIRALRTAVDNLYAVLDEAQKQTLKALLTRRDRG